MKRSLLQLSLLFLTVISANANSVTEQQALRIAQQFLNKKNLVIEHNKLLTRGNTRQNEALLYVFNAEEGGYAVVSGDDQTAPILGYSETGRLDMENLPEHIQSWLDGYVDQIAFLQSHPNVSKARNTLNEPAIEPLLGEIEWNQESPYNDLCPYDINSYNKKVRCPTGCTATAMAQIMYYHKWPQQVMQDIPSYVTRSKKIEVSSIAAGTTINWNSILPKYGYDSKNETDKQRQAVAELMQICGTSVEMNYMSGGSEAYLQDAAKALKKYFDYGAAVSYVERNDYREEDWNKMIYNELAAGRPVEYAGYSVSFNGHAFVIDGYSKDCFFHVNWGWGGSMNGYFLLSVLNPYDENLTSTTEEDSGYESSYTFKMYQEAVVGIKKNDGQTITIKPGTGNSKQYPDITIEPVGTLYAGSKGFVKAIVTSKGEDSRFYVKVKLDEKIQTGFLIEVDAGQTKEYIFSVNPVEPGEAIISLYNYWPDRLIMSSTIDIQKPKDHLLKIALEAKDAQDGVVTADVLRMKATVTNLGLRAYDGNLLFNIYQVTNRSCPIVIAGEQTKDLEFEFGYLESGKYSIKPFYYKNGKEVRGGEWCDIEYRNTNAKSPYTIYKDGVLTFYFDENKSSRQGTIYEIKSSTGSPGWKEVNGSVQKVVFDKSFADYTPNNTYCWFSGCKGLTEIVGIEYLKTASVMDMRSMFSGCSSLTSLDVSGFDTSGAEYMDDMFYGCSSLTTLDVSHFDTSNVSLMRSMFSGCSNLTSLDVSHFDTGNVTGMGRMFYGCSNLTSLDVSHFDTRNVTGMRSMFEGCSSLTSLDVSHFDTRDVTGMGSMFEGCSSLASLDVRNFDTRKVTDMNYMFAKCSSLTTLDVSHFNTSSVNYMNFMFGRCSGLTSLDVSHFDTNSVTDMGEMFHGCSNLTNLDVSHFDTRNVASMRYMFYECSGMTSLDVSNFKTNTVSDMSGMFQRCSSVERIIYDKDFETSESVTINNMFLGCKSLKCIEFKGQLPAHVKSNFFNGVGSVDAPATLLVPEEYKADYQAKFNGNMFFGGYLSLEGRENPDPTVDAVTLTARSYSRQYGEDNPEFDFIVSEGTLKSGTPNITCTATSASPVGTYPIVITQGSVGNSKVTLVNGTLTITEAPLTISVGNYTRRVGEDNPEFKLTYSGFKNNETESVLTKLPTISCTAKASSAPGLYPITVSGAEAQNYSFIYNNGALTVISSSIPDPDSNASPYVALKDGTLTFYCDTLRGERQGDVYNLNKEFNVPNWYTRVEEITKVVFDPSFGNARPASTNCWFSKCTSLTEIQGLGFLNTSKTTIMHMMFEKCAKLTSLDVSNFDTRQVTDMYGLFSGCSALTNLNLGNFNTSNVTDMGGMFHNCSGLTSLDLSNFNTSNVTNMDGMFDNCSGLTSLDLSNFNTSNVTNMRNMFVDCRSLTSLDVSIFRTDQVSTVYGMFSGCSHISSLDLSNFNTSKITDMGRMFFGCVSLTSLDVSFFDTKNVTRMKEMFCRCSNINRIDLANFNTKNVTDMSYLLSECNNLKLVVLGSEFVTSDDIKYNGVFNGIWGLKEIVFTGDITSTIGSNFFAKVGSAKSPATLTVPEQFKSNYKAKFDENMFYGGYFTLNGVTGISNSILEKHSFDVYSLNGTLVKKNAEYLKLLPKGIYIVNGRKVVVK